MVKYYPNVRIQGKRNGQTQPSGSSFEAPKRNRFMHSRVGMNKRSLPTLLRYTSLFY